MIGFAGLTHLGIVSSIAAAAKGWDVLAFDMDAALIGSLCAGRLPIAEEGLDALLASARRRLSYSSRIEDVASCDMVYISLDMVTDDSGQCELTEFDAMLDRVARHLSPDAVLVLLSQVPPGTTRSRLERLRENSAAATRSMFYQVETLVVGNAVERALRPERFIVGCASPTTPLPEPFARFLAGFDCPVLRLNYESAELSKIAINLFLVSSISTTNMLAELCEASGANWHEIVPALRLDRRIGTHAYLQPGLGISGGNLERDIASARALASEWGTDAALLDTWLTSSARRADWALRQLHAEILTIIDKPAIALWGLAYKVGTASIKNSPALRLIDGLSTCRVRIHDPRATLPLGRATCETTGSALDACMDADALVVLTPWPEFSGLNLFAIKEAMRGRVIIDPLGVLNGQECRRHGFRYFTLGERASQKASIA